jgi:hypothetical protein
VSDYSRPLSLAEMVTGRGASELERHLSEQTVQVSADPELPGALSAATRFVATLARMPGQLQVQADAESAEWRDDLLAAAVAVRPSVIARPGGRPAVQMHFGVDAPPGAIRAVPDAYGAHVASDPRTELHQHRPANALGAAVAAALAATEIFKLVAAVPESRAARHARLSFCPVALGDDVTLAPDLRSSLRVNIALVGLGAVGSASASILGDLPLAGDALLVDRERFAPENLATYSLGGEEAAESQPWKVDLAAEATRNFAVTRSTEPVESLPREIDSGERTWPSVVLSGLDSIAARHATQRIWPDLLIDAATGETMVGIHVAEPDRPCMMCFFPPRHDGPSAAERLAAATGLSVARAGRGDNPLTEEDLDDLTSGQRAMLAPHLGKPVCGLAASFGLSGLEANGYLPAIPFAAQQAACLGVGRLIAHLLDVNRPDNIAQYDVFRGPRLATIDQHAPRPDCYCTERQATIGRVRELRRSRCDAN